MAIQSALRQHAVSFVERTGCMIVEPCQQFYCFAAVALKHGIIENEDRFLFADVSN
ncbi:hypothetical protein JCM10914_3424 [Paenibacillus sp. JCM 10914]|nr:hypothetical protein JCM10914_3424 [Paenibacillus sp. JCM 10914]